jgi:hypothetical protein
MSKTIAFVSAFVSAVSVAVIFKLCLIYTCESLIYANAVLSTTFTMLVCLKTFEMRAELEEYERRSNHSENENRDEHEGSVDTALFNKLSVIKDIQLSFVIPCIVSVIDELYETFGWCLNPLFVLIEKYLQIFHPNHNVDEQPENIKYTFISKILSQLDNNSDYRTVFANVLQEMIDEIDAEQRVSNEPGVEVSVEELVVEPVIEVPVVEPVVEVPVSNEPVVEVPVSNEPVVEVPVSDEPVVEVPVVEPVVEVPVVEPVVEVPVVEPVVEVPVVEPVVEVPVVEVPVVETVVETNSEDSIDYKTELKNNE